MGIPDFTNDSFPLDAYFFPLTNDTGFASVASSSNPEPFLLPSEIDLGGQQLSRLA